MKRRLLKLAPRIALFLLLGAIINIAVAWGCALWLRGTDWWNLGFVEPLPRFVFTSAAASWSDIVADKNQEKELFRAQSWGRSSFVLYVMAEGRDYTWWMTPDYRLQIEQVGWPARSFQCVAHDDLRGLPRRDRFKVPDSWHGGIVLPQQCGTNSTPLHRWFQFKHPLPMEPIVAGQVFNSLFYAVLVWAIAAFVTASWRRRVRFPRRIGVMIIYLCAGACVTLAVAWMCAAWSPVRAWWSLTTFDGNFSSEDRALIPAAWLVPPTSPNGHLFIGLEQADAFGWTMSVIDSEVKQAGVMTMGPGRMVQIYRAGWPLHALQCHAIVPQPGGMWATGTRVVDWHGGMASIAGLKPASTNHADAMERGLPWCPLWPGFAINTIFYAAILWMLFAFPFALRRRRRIKRGLCPSCAYPIGGSQVCTECGKPTPQKPMTQIQQ